MPEISDGTYWSETDASNNAAAPNGWAETTMLPSEVNDTARADRGAIKRAWDRMNYQLTAGGGTTAYTLTPSVALASYAAGEVWTFIMPSANAADASINISGIGARNLRKSTPAGYINLAADDLPSGTKVAIVTNNADAKFDIVSAIPAAESVVQIVTGAAVSALTVDAIPSWAREIEITFDVVCGTNNVTLSLVPRKGSGGGITDITDCYGSRTVPDGTAIPAVGYVSGTAYNLANNVGNASGLGAGGTIRIYNAQSGAAKRGTLHASYYSTIPLHTEVSGSILINDVAPITGIKIQPSSGTFTGYMRVVARR